METNWLEFFCKHGDELIVNNKGIHMTWAAVEQDVGGGCECRQRSNAYGQEHPSIQERQGEASQSGKVQHQGLHEAFYLCLQRVHACHRCCM